MGIRVTRFREIIVTGSDWFFPIKSKSLQTSESPPRPTGAGFLFFVVIPNPACPDAGRVAGFWRTAVRNLLFAYTSSSRAFCLRCARRKFHPERRKPRRVPMNLRASENFTLRPPSPKGDRLARDVKELTDKESPSRPTGTGFLFCVVIPSEDATSIRRGICCSSILHRAEPFCFRPHPSIVIPPALRHEGNPVARSWRMVVRNLLFVYTSSSRAFSFYSRRQTDLSLVCGHQCAYNPGDGAPPKNAAG